LKPAEPRTEVERPRDFEPEGPRRANQMWGDRVRVFGDVTVARDEEIIGEVVAVFGSVKVDGEVRQEVVSVFGSIDLGPEAVVGGDVVAVGGRVRRAPGSRARRGVTEISLAEISIGNPDFRMHIPPVFRGRSGPLYWFGPGFGAVPRLIGTLVRLGLILLVAGIALLVARPAVEGAAQRVADSPIKATLVGLTAQLLIIPVLLLTALLLIMTVIGIPLIALLPFVVLFLVLLAIVGFTGAAAAEAVGCSGISATAGTVRRSHDGRAGTVAAAARPHARGRWVTATPIAVLLIFVGFVVELLAWSGGFGAALTNSHALACAERCAATARRRQRRR
jgi:hypothetical protein